MGLIARGHDPREQRVVRIDEFLDSYVTWRQRCADVANAYDNWRRSPAVGRDFAFSAYNRALDREERAARTHRDCTERLRVDAA